MSTHNIGFHVDLTKIIFELSSNTHLISSAINVAAWEIAALTTLFTMSSLCILTICEFSSFPHRF